MIRESNIVDPVHVRMCLSSECGRVLRLVLFVGLDGIRNVAAPLKVKI